MKKTILIGMALGIVSMAATQALAGASIDRGEVTPSKAEAGGIQKNWGGEGIVGSSHDLSYEAGYTNTGGGSNSGALTNSGVGIGVTDKQKRICIYCHHPHNSIQAVAGTEMAYSPLWNREMSQVTFAAYTNGLDDAVVDAGASDKRHNLNAVSASGLGPVSLLCMSCHDGVVAMNAYSVDGGAYSSGSLDGKGDGAGGQLGGRTSGFEGGPGDMSNHHPMGFDYQTVQTADAEIAGVNTPLVPDGSVRISDVLYDGSMECVTCHDVHNTSNQDNAERFLWRTNDFSNFCLTCHLK